MTVGAVEVGFFVMADFMNYKSGIFHSNSKQTLGGHAVKIVGWGHLLERFYWIVQNSWGPAWGEEGYFRIDNWREGAWILFYFIYRYTLCESCSRFDLPPPHIL